RGPIRRASRPHRRARRGWLSHRLQGRETRRRRATRKRDLRPRRADRRGSAPRRDRRGHRAGAGRRPRLRSGLAGGAPADDWRAMTARVADVIAELKANPPPLPAAEIAEAVAFLEWLADNNFTFLGVRNYKFTPGEDMLEPVFESGLGILRARDMRVLQRWNQPLVITPEMRALIKQPTLLIVTKAAVRSRVHRP